MHMYIHINVNHVYTLVHVHTCTYTQHMHKHIHTTYTTHALYTCTHVHTCIQYSHAQTHSLSLLLVSWFVCLCSSALTEAKDAYHRTHADNHAPSLPPDSIPVPVPAQDREARCVVLMSMLVLQGKGYFTRNPLSIVKGVAC